MIVLAGVVLVGALSIRGTDRRSQRRAARARLRPSDHGARHSWSVPPAVLRLLDDADVGAPPTQVVGAWLALLPLALLLGGLVGGPGAALLAAAGALVGPVVALRLRAGRGDERLAQRLPVVLEAVAAAVRAGMTLPSAVRGAADSATGSATLDGDLTRCRRDLDRGVPFEQVVDTWAAGRPLPEVRLATAALALGTEAGGARAQALDAVALTLRERAALGREVMALSSQARASASVIIAAPVVFAALGLLSSPGVAAFLFRTPAGLACLVVGLGLDAVAAVWIARLARPSW